MPCNMPISEMRGIVQLLCFRIIYWSKYIFTNKKFSKQKKSRTII